MTAAEWLACTHPHKMLASLRGKVSVHKVSRLYAACCRRIQYPTGERQSTNHREAALAEPDGMGPETGIDSLEGPYDPIAFEDFSPFLLGAVFEAVGILGAEKERRIAVACLIRDIFGNPFNPVTLDCTCLTPTVTSLATAAYEDRTMPSGELDAARLAVLADALEEAGCDNADILNHLRGPGQHVRGCWVVDLILRKT
jgi:hypothetical protein